MATKALDSKLQQYWPHLGDEEKRSILTFIKSFIKIKDAPPQRISIEQYNRELEEAEIDAGHFTTQEEAKKQAQLWFSK